MAGSVNKVILLGHLGRDPEVRHAQDGTKIVQLSVATSESWKDKTTGERRERTEWHRVVIFNERIADAAERFLRKGAKVYLEGASQTRKWTGQDGQERTVTEVVLARYRGELTMLDKREGGVPPAGGPGDYGRESAQAGQEAGSATGATGMNQEAGSAPPASGAISDLDDEIPF